MISNKLKMQLTIVTRSLSNLNIVTETKKRRRQMQDARNTGVTIELEIT